MKYNHAEKKKKIALILKELDIGMKPQTVYLNNNVIQSNECTIKSLIVTLQNSLIFE